MTEPTVAPFVETNVLFQRAYPVSFRILNEKMEEKIYLEDKPSSGVFELSNDSGRGLHFVPAHHGAIAGPDNYHFALKFRPGILKSDVKSLIKHKIIQKGWTLSTGLEESTTVLYFLNTGKASLDPGKKILLPLRELRMQADEGTQVTQVELSCMNLAKDPAYTQVLQPHIRHFNLTLINHRGSPVMPIHVGFTGFNAILNDRSPNELTLRITNQQKRIPQRNGAFTFSHDKHSRMYLYFETDSEQSDYALGTVDQVAGIEMDFTLPVQKQDNEGNTSHLVHEPMFQGDTPIWEIYPEYGDVVLQPHQTKLHPDDSSPLPDDSCMDIVLSNIISNCYMGTTHLYLRLENIPGFWDQTFTIPILKQPMVFVDRYDVTITIPDNESKVSIKQAVNKLLKIYKHPEIGNSTATINNITIHEVKKLTQAGAIINIVDSTDFVGIGTTEPEEKLSIYTPRGNFGFSHTDNEVKICSFIGGTGKNSAGWFGTKSKHDLHFFTDITANSPRMTIDKDGKVGIGKPPDGTNKLSVLGSADISENVKISGRLGIGQEADATVGLSVHGTSKFNGNVGIGKEPHGTNKLSVEGNADVNGNVNISGSSNKLSVEGTSKFTGNIGIGTEPDDNNQLSVSGNAKVIGVLSTGRIKMTGGSPGQGKLLMSDANGLATWESVLSILPGISSAGGRASNKGDIICSANIGSSKGALILFAGQMKRKKPDGDNNPHYSDFFMLIRLDSYNNVFVISEAGTSREFVAENKFKVSFYGAWFTIAFARTNNNMLKITYENAEGTAQSIEGNILVLANTQ